MTETPRVGMVEEIDVTGAGPSDGAIAFVRAYVADGPLDPAIAKQFLAPELVAAREARAAAQRVLDWPNLNYYRSANAGMVTAPDCVFIGSSITEMWMAGDPALFEGGNVSRGISGQTSAQMLLRFMADVVALKPRVVHVLVGVNDIAGNTGPTTLNDYCNNMMAMMLLAEAHGIRVILGTLAPHAKIPWAPAIEPQRWIAKINEWLRETARARGHVLADYHAAFDAGGGQMGRDLTRDGVHPTGAGYRAMRPIIEAALRAV